MAPVAFSQSTIMKPIGGPNLTDERKNSNSLLTALLIPFSVVYGIGVFLRNKFFDTGIFTSREFPLPIISVGNITVGGTGKTPHVEHIVSVLKDEFRVAVLSRGYKRKSSGFVLASASSDAEEVGDEPLQIKKKFPEAEVAVSADRVGGVRKLCNYNKSIQAVILDDAFQHRWIKPGISVLIVDYNRPVMHDRLLPAGRLREGVSSKERASIVIVSKCPPGITPIERRIFKKDMDLSPWQSLYFTSFSYGDPLPVFKEGDPFPAKKASSAGEPVVLMVTGIATPGILKKYLMDIFPEIVQVSFPDHHNFTGKDIQRIEKEWNMIGNKRKLIITTEKDAMRLQKTPGIDPLIKKNMYYIPVQVKFGEKNSNKFKKQIVDYVRKNKRNHIVSHK